MSATEKNFIILPARLDVRCADDADYRFVMDDLKRYRAAARQAFCAMAMAHIAGAKIEEHASGLRVVGDNDAAKTILAKSMGMRVQQRTKPAVAKALKTIADICAKTEAREKLGENHARRLDEMLHAVSDAAERHNWAEDISDQGAAPAYEVRDFVLNDLLPGWRAFAFDGLRRELVSLWTANDPEHPKATRGWLMLNGARMLARFMRIGLEFPVLSGAHTFGSNSITLKWRDDKSVEFKLLDMDRARWQQFTDARDGVCEFGSLSLLERDGRLRIVIPMKRKLRAKQNDPERVATVTLENGALKTVARGDVDIIPVAAAVAQMARLKKQSAHFETLKRPTGSPVRKWGAKRAFESEAARLRRITERRTNAQQDWNHRWTRRIADVAARRGCGTLKFTAPSSAELAAGVPWSWSQFENYLQYKCRCAGMVLAE